MKVKPIVPSEDEIPLFVDAERRFLPRRVELRAASEGSSSPGTIVGYAATFNESSLDLGGFREVIMPGAFRGCMGQDVRCLRNHDDDVILGRSVAGTLRMEEDETGLRFECDLPNTTHGRDTAELVARGDITGCSFQFVLDPDGEDWDWTGPVPVRRVRSVARLYDVGPVTFPAYESTRVDMRSVEAVRTHQSAAIRQFQSRLLARQRVAEAELVPGLP